MKSNRLYTANMEGVTALSESLNLKSDIDVQSLVDGLLESVRVQSSNRKIGYVTPQSVRCANEDIRREDAKIERLQAVLAERGEGWNELLAIEKKGLDEAARQAERQAADWCDRIGAPDDFRKDAIRRARASVDHERVAKLRMAMSGIKSADIDHSGAQWRLKDEKVRALYETYVTQLDPRETEDFTSIRVFYALRDSLEERGIDIHGLLRAFPTEVDIDGVRGAYAPMNDRRLSKEEREAARREWSSRFF